MVDLRCDATARRNTRPSDLSVTTFRESGPCVDIPPAHVLRFIHGVSRFRSTCRVCPHFGPRFYLYCSTCFSQHQNLWLHFRKLRCTIHSTRRLSRYISSGEGACYPQFSLISSVVYAHHPHRLVIMSIRPGTYIITSVIEERPIGRDAAKEDGSSYPKPVFRLPGGVEAPHVRIHFRHTLHLQNSHRPLYSGRSPGTTTGVIP